MKIIHASAVVLVDRDNRVLIQKRAADNQLMPNYWEFPGGKMEENETPEQAIVREVKEELGVDLGCRAPLSFISSDRDDHHIIVYLFISRDTNGIPHGKEGQEIKWVRVNELNNYELLPENKPLIPIIRDFV